MPDQSRIFLYIFFTLLLLTGCKENEEATTSKGSKLISSTWWLILQSGDMIIDKEMYCMFRSNGEFFETNVTRGYWSLADNEKTLNIDRDGVKSSYQVFELTSSEFRFRDKANINDMHHYRAAPDTKVTDQGVSKVSSTGATLHGIARTGKTAIEVSFEYGLSQTYGTTINAKTIALLTFDNSIKAELTGLEPGKIYHYRIISQSGTEVIKGENLTFRTFNSGKIRDRQGNEYNTITIGTQVWMAENLRSTVYTDGKPIRKVTGNQVWATTNVPAYCWHQNDSVVYEKFGVLYNWNAIDKENVCPEGWHVPTINDWFTLKNNLGATASIKLMEAQPDHPDFYLHPTNESGFSARVGSSRSAENGSFASGDEPIIFWTNTDNDPQKAYRSKITLSGVENITTDKKTGYSVRCLKK